MRRSVRRGVPAAFVVASLLAGLGWATPVVAVPGTVTGLFLDSEPGDYIGQGVATTMAAPVSTFTVLDPGPEFVRLSVTSPSSWWYINLAAPPGASLAVGTYAGATRAAFRQPGEPGIDVFGEGRGCNTIAGSFTVHEIAWEGATLERFAASFEQHCEGWMAALRGEIRYQSSVDFVALAMPAAGTFAARNVGTTSTSKAFKVTNTGTAPLTVSSVGLGGTNPGDFLLYSQTCTAAPVAPGGTCAILVRFGPLAPGVREALVELADGTARGEHAFAVKGTGTLPVAGISLTPASLAFGDVLVGKTATRTLTVGSTGTAPLTISGIGVSGPDAARFKIAAQGCPVGTPIAVGSRCTVKVSFKPTATGARTATLTVASDAPPGSHEIPLGGAGILPISRVTWGSVVAAGPAYTWNAGTSLGRTTSSTASYLHAVYATDRIGGKWAAPTGPYVGVYYTRSANGGTSWTTGARLNSSTQHAGRVTTATSGSYVYTAWVSIKNPFAYSNTAPRTLYFRASSGHGAGGTWLPIVRLSSTTGRVDWPAIAASGASVYVAWTDSATGAIRLSISRNRGLTWSTKTIGTTTAKYADGYYGNPTIAAAGSYVGVAWDSSSSGGEKAVVSTNSGTTFGTTISLTGGSQSSLAAAALGDRLAFSWVTGSAVQARIWKAGAWQPVRTVATFPADGPYRAGYSPAVALVGTSGVGVAWSDCRAADCAYASGSDLSWSESASNGTQFTERQVLGPSTGSSARRINDFPSVVWASPSTRYVMWNGWTYGTNYYRQYLRVGSGAP